MKILAVNDPKQGISKLLKIIPILENEVTIEKSEKTTVSVNIFDALNEHIFMTRK